MDPVLHAGLALERSWPVEETGVDGLESMGFQDGRVLRNRGEVVAAGYVLAVSITLDHSFNGVYDSFDIAFAAHLRHKPAASSQSARQRRNNAAGLQHPVQRGIGKDGIKLVVIRESGGVL